MDEAEVGCWKPENPCGQGQEGGTEEALACQQRLRPQCFLCRVDQLVTGDPSCLTQEDAIYSSIHSFIQQLFAEHTLGTRHCQRLLCILFPWEHLLKPRAHPGCVTLGRALKSGLITGDGGGAGADPGADAKSVGAGLPPASLQSHHFRDLVLQSKIRAVTRKVAHGCWIVKNHKYSH